MKEWPLLADHDRSWATRMAADWRDGFGITKNHRRTMAEVFVGRAWDEDYLREFGRATEVVMEDWSGWREREARKRLGIDGSGNGRQD